MGGNGSGPQPSGPQGLAAMMSGIMPVKTGVDAINQAVKQIAGAGIIPGAGQILEQIVALANSLLPMAAQNALQPSGSPGPGGGPPPPPGPLTSGQPGAGGPVPQGANQ